jgi:hypothetical protein
MVHHAIDVPCVTAVGAVQKAAGSLRTNMEPILKKVMTTVLAQEGKLVENVVSTARAGIDTVMPSVLEAMEKALKPVFAPLGQILEQIVKTATELFERVKKEINGPITEKRLRQIFNDVRAQVPSMLVKVDENFNKIAAKLREVKKFDFTEQIELMDSIRADLPGVLASTLEQAEHAVIVEVFHPAAAAMAHHKSSKAVAPEPSIDSNAVLDALNLHMNVAIADLANDAKWMLWDVVAGLLIPLAEQQWDQYIVSAITKAGTFVDEQLAKLSEDIKEFISVAELLLRSGVELWNIMVEMLCGPVLTPAYAAVDEALEKAGVFKAIAELEEKKKAAAKK